MKNLLFTAVLILFSQINFAQLNQIKFEQIDSLQKIEKRKIIVFIYTDWCKFCGVMKSSTFKNKEIIKKINDSFYFIALNAEEKKPILFRNQIFSFKPTGIEAGIHELATELATINKQIVFPTLCVLNENYEIVLQHNNYLNAKDLKLFLKQIED